MNSSAQVPNPISATTMADFFAQQLCEAIKKNDLAWLERISRAAQQTLSLRQQLDELTGCGRIEHSHAESKPSELLGASVELIPELQEARSASEWLDAKTSTLKGTESTSCSLSACWVDELPTGTLKQLCFGR